MSDRTHCLMCGKSLTGFVGMTNIRTPRCECPPEPTMADLIAEIRACRAEMRAIRDNTERLNTRATGFALLHTGEAVIPAKPS